MSFMEKQDDILENQMSSQPICNFGMIGHVSNGKSTIVKHLTGTATQRDSREIASNKTIKLGYANAKIFKCMQCPSPECYKASSSETKKMNCEQCKSDMNLVNHISFVDCFEPSTKVLMYDGTIKMVSELHKQDLLVGPDGKTRTILNIVEGEKEMYEVRYKNNNNKYWDPINFECTGGHILVLRIDNPVDFPRESNDGKYYVGIIHVENNNIHFKQSFHDTLDETLKFYYSQNKNPITIEITVETYLKLPESIREKMRLFYSPSLEFDYEIIESKLSIKIPEIKTELISTEEFCWLLGVWLADNTSFNATLVTLLSSKNDTPITNTYETDIPVITQRLNELENIQKIESIANKLGLKIIRNISERTNEHNLKLSTNPIENLNDNNKNNFVQLLKNYNLLGKLRLGNKLKFQQENIRKMIVAGLIDSDSCYDKGKMDLIQLEENKEFMDDILWLFRSVGLNAYITGMENRRNYFKYRILFSGDTSKLPINSPLKRGYIENPSLSQQFVILKSGIKNYKGFEVDGDGRFLLSDFIVAHNCPGHNLLMATMMNGTCVMDYTILVESMGNKDIPAPQTVEHIRATTLTGTQNKIVCLNKLDLIRKDDAVRKINEFGKYLEKTIAKDSVMIPLSATHGFNIDILCEYLANIKPPERKLEVPCRMIVIRSFNVNNPGTRIQDLHGGVIGGSIVEGIIKTNDRIILKPGFIGKNKDFNPNDEDCKRFTYKPLDATVISIKSDKNKLQQAVPGGLIGVELDIDPSLASDDGLIGNILMAYDNKDMYMVCEDIIVEFTPFDEVDKKIEKNTKVIININACNSNCTVIFSKRKELGLQMDARPICIKVGDIVTISTYARQDSGIHILGMGRIIRGNSCISL